MSHSPSLPISLPTWRNGRSRLHLTYYGFASLSLGDRAVWMTSKRNFKSQLPFLSDWFEEKKSLPRVCNQFLPISTFEVRLKWVIPLINWALKLLLNFHLSLKMLKINLFIKQIMFYSSYILHDFSIDVSKVNFDTFFLVFSSSIF